MGENRNATETINERERREGFRVLKGRHAGAESSQVFLCTEILGMNKELPKKIEEGGVGIEVL